MITPEIQQWSEQAQQRFAGYYFPRDAIYFAYRLHPGVRLDNPSRRNYTLNKTFIDLSEYLITVDDSGLWLAVSSGSYFGQLYNRTSMGGPEHTNDLRDTHCYSIALDLWRGEFFIGPYLSIGEALEGAALIDELDCFGGVNEHLLYTRSTHFPRCKETSRFVISCERCHLSVTPPTSERPNLSDIQMFFTAIAGERCNP